MIFGAESNVHQLSKVDKVQSFTVQHFIGLHFIKWDLDGDSVVIIYFRKH